MEGYTEVFVWGGDHFGQLGLSGKQSGKTYCVPRFCSFNILIKKVACGEEHSAFIATSGHVYSMGNNSEGRLGLGNNSLKSSPSPCLVEALHPYKCVDVDCGWGHTLALTSEGEVFSWGVGEYGALGIRSTESQWEPVRVLSRAKGVQVACGSRHSVMVSSDGRAYAWGAGEAGQLGNGRRERELIPTEVDIRENVRNAAAGIFHTLLLTKGGKVFSMGGNSFGQLGTGNKKSSCAPVRVEALEGIYIDKIASGHHSAAISERGDLFIWGTGVFGEYVYPRNISSYFKAGVQEVAIGGNFGIAVDASFTIYAWGANNNGELGVGDYEIRDVPNPVISLKGKQVRQISCGGSFAVALGNDVFNKRAVRSQTPTRSVNKTQHLEERKSFDHRRKKGASRDYSRERPTRDTDLITHKYEELEHKYQEEHHRRVRAESRLDYDVVKGKYEQENIIRQLEEELQMKNSELQHLQEKFNVNFSELTSLEEKLHLRNNEIQTLEDKLNLRNSEIQNLEDNLNWRISEAQDKESRMKTTNNEINSLKEELRELKYRLNQSNEEIEDLNYKLEEERESYSKNYEEANKEIRNLSYTLDQERSNSRKQLEESSKEMERLRNQVRENHAKSQDLNYSLQQFSLEIEHLKQSLEDSKGMNFELSKENETLKKELEETLRESEKHSRESKRLNEELRRLESSYSTFKSSANTEKLKADEEIKLQKGKLTDEIYYYKSLLEEEKQKSWKLQEELELTKQDNHRLQNEVGRVTENLRVTEDNLSYSNNVNESLSSENKNLSSELRSANGTIDQLKEKINYFNGEIERLNSLLQDYNAKNDSSSMDIADLTKENNYLKQITDDLQYKLEKANYEGSQYSSETENLKLMIKDWEQKYNNLLEENRALEHKYSELENKNADLFNNLQRELSQRAREYRDRTMNMLHTPNRPSGPIGQSSPGLTAKREASRSATPDPYANSTASRLLNVLESSSPDKRSPEKRINTQSDFMTEPRISVTPKHGPIRDRIANLLQNKSAIENRIRELEASPGA